MGDAATCSLNAVSRQHETEADTLGLDLLFRASSEPREAPELWKRMGEIGGERPPPWLSTHPASEERARNFELWMPDAIALYERQCGALR
ncbi:MAG: M48 family metalloprotease, partial [Pseudomonadota bacterium]